MNDDVFELVDREYGECQQVNYPKQIKTRNSSFQSILGRFRSFRIKLLERKLDRMKDKALNSVYTERNFDSKLTKKSEAIARLEEKIKVLSREEVPTNYVDNRAIKLKQSMIENLQRKVGFIYSVDATKKEEIFASEAPVVEMPTVLATAASKDNNSELDIDTIDRQTIVDTINEGFSNEEAIADAPTINRDEIKDVVDEEVVKIEDNPTIDREAIEQSINEEFEKQEAVAEEEVVVEEHPENNDNLTSEEIKSVIEEELGKIEESIPEMDVVPQPEVKDEIVPVAEDVVEQDNHFRVSHNNTNNAKLSRYDENGNDIKEYTFEQATVEEPVAESIVEIDPKQPTKKPRRRKYNYVPMTDEEIRESQIKLGLDEHGNFVDKEETKEEVVAKAEPVKEVTDLAVLPEYIISESIKPVDNIDTSAIDNKVVVEEVKSNKASIDNYTALKEKILHLREQQEQTKKQKEEAERKAEEAKQKAREIREMVAESEKSVAESIDMLRAYSEALEEDCDRNIKSAEASESSAEADYQFVSTNQEKLDSNAELIREIDSLIGPRVDPESIKVK